MENQDCKLSEPDISRTREIFRKLDDCVDSIQEGERSGNWSNADAEVAAFARLLNYSDVANGIAHALALGAGIVRSDWVLIVVSVATLLSVATGMYISRVRRDRACASRESKD